MSYWKECTLLVTSFIMLACAWHLMYIKPAATMNAMVYDCMTQIGDTSQAGYSLCRNFLKPQ